MKKFLNLLGTITLIATTATTVVSCSKSSPPPKPGPQKNKAKIVTQELANEITNKNIELPYGQSYSTAKDKTTLISAFEKANPKMTADLKKHEGQIDFVDNKTIIPLEKQQATNIQIQIETAKTKSRPLQVGFQVYDKWSQIKKGIAPNVKTFFAPQLVNNVYYEATLGNGLFRSFDGQVWHHVTGGLPGNAQIYYPPKIIDNVYYVSTLSHGLYKSTDGINWTQVAGGLPSNAPIYASIEKIKNVYYVATFNKGLYASSDHGLTWKTVTIPAQIYYPPVFINNTYYVATFSQGLYTSNDGMTWKKVDGGLEKVGLFSPPVFINNNYYAATSYNDNGLFQSQDGVHWTHITNGLPAKAQIYYPVKKIGETYYVATNSHGLYTSSDGLKWTQVSNELSTKARIYSSPVKIKNNYYVGTYNNGVWEVYSSLSQQIKIIKYKKD